MRYQQRYRFDLLLGQVIPADARDVSSRSNGYEAAMHDLTPVTQMVTRVVIDITDDQLGAPTPCRDATVADLLDHLDGLSQAFTAAAGKDVAMANQTPVADGSRLAPDWRDRIPGRLAGLAA